jgi:hypothetical protein
MMSDFEDDPGGIARFQNHDDVKVTGGAEAQAEVREGKPR